jgi:hypothetical protein
MELVQRFPVEIARLIYSFGSFELRVQKENYLRHIRTRIPRLTTDYLNACLLTDLDFIHFFSLKTAEERCRIFRKLRQCCCCQRHLARRPIHEIDARILNFHNRDAEPECDCACRYLMRRVAMAAYV